MNSFLPESKQEINAGRFVITPLGGLFYISAFQDVWIGGMNVIGFNYGIPFGKVRVYTRESFLKTTNN